MFKKVLNLEIYEELPLNMCISIKVSRNGLKTSFAHIQYEHGAPPISLNSQGAKQV
jgi:hypothetical protein